MASGRTSEGDALRASIHYAVAKICETEAQEAGIFVSKSTVATLTELCLRHSRTLAEDLEHFAQHARRTKVTPDDVMLCARKDPGFHAKLAEFNSTIQEANAAAASAAKRRRTVAAAAGSAAPADAGGDQ